MGRWRRTARIAPPSAPPPGFRGTTTRELALAVGVSEPVLYQHFATKRDLYTAIVDQMVVEAAAEGEAALCQFEGTTDDRSFFQWFGEQVLNWYLDESNHPPALSPGSR